MWLYHTCGMQATLKAYASAEALWLADQPSRVKSVYLCKCFPGADAKVVHAALTSCKGVTEQSIQVCARGSCRMPCLLLSAHAEIAWYKLHITCCASYLPGKHNLDVKDKVSCPQEGSVVRLSSGHGRSQCKPLHS